MEKKVKKTWRWLLVFAGLILLAVAALPSLLFSSFVLNHFLLRVNPSLEGHLSLEKCSAGYFETIACRNIQYDSPRHGIHLFVPGIELDRGLVTLLLAPRNPGEIVLDSPELAVDPKLFNRESSSPAAGQGQTVQEGARLPSGERKEQPEQTESAVTRPFWEELLIRLRVNNGLAVVRRTGAPLGPVEKINLQAELKSGTITYNLGFSLGEEMGEIKAGGFFNLPIHHQAVAATLTTKTEMDMAAVDLGLLYKFVTALAEKKESLPQGEGIVNGKVLFTSAGLDNVAVNGNLLVENLGFSGGVLKGDTPSFGSLQFVVDAARTGRRNWSFSTLLLESDLLALQGSGRLTEEKGELHFTGNLSLPKLFSELPHTLRIREGVNVNEGNITFTSTIHRESNSTVLEAQCSTAAIRGRYKDQLLLWDNPLAISVNAREESGAFQLSSLALTTPFLQANGQGNLNHFSFTGEVELEKTLHDINNLFDLEGKGAGRLLVSGSAEIDDQDQYQVELDAHSEAFFLELFNKPVFPRHPLRFSANARVPATWLRSSDPLEMDIELEAWLGRIRVQGREVKSGTSLSGSYDVTTTLELGPLNDFFRHYSDALPSLALTGRTNINLVAGWVPPLLSLDKVRIETAELALGYGQMEYQDEKVVLEISGYPSTAVPLSVRPVTIAEDLESYRQPPGEVSTLDLQSGELIFSNVKLDSGVLQIAQGDVRVQDWRNPDNGFEGRVVGTFLVENLMEVVRAAGKLPEQIQLQGDAVAAGYFEGNGQGVKSNVELLMDSVTLKNGKQILLENDVVTAWGRIERGKNSKRFVLRDMEFHSPFGEVRGQGSVHTGKQPSMEIEGELLPDSRQAAEFFKTVTGQEVQLTHWHSGAFSAVIPLQAAVGIKGGPERFNYTTTLDSLVFSGVDIRDATLGVELEEGRGRLSLQAGLNNGVLNLHPDIISGNGRTMLSVTSPQQIMQGVEIQQPLMEGVLARIHPLFGVIAQPEGRINIDLEELTSPVSTVDKSAFTAVLDLQGIRLNQNGMLGEILDFFQAGEDALEFGDTEITCRAFAERVSCSPVRLLVAESEMTLSGSIGFDGSVDYKLVVPLTRELIGKEGYRVLEGARITVPISGTVENPFYNRDDLGYAVRSVLKQAATKAVEKQLEKSLPGFLDKLLGR